MLQYMKVIVDKHIVCLNLFVLFISYLVLKMILGLGFYASSSQDPT